MTSARLLAVLLAMFFCSGACGLTYQVLWLRLLALVFGVTAYAASTVLAAFMTGLACGSLLAGPLLRRLPRPLLVFGVAEILVGLSAVATPLLLDGAALVYARLRAASDSFVLLTAARLLGSFVVLLVPTALMGLTLPVLCASRMVRETRFGARLSALYAANTLGALAGAALTGFVLVGAIGMQQSFLLAASLNAAVGCVALLLERRQAGDDAEPSVARDAGFTELGQASASIDNTILALAVTVSGLAALALEVVWFRMLVQLLDATTYAFSTMLAAVLAGIAAGGAVAARLLRRDRNWPLWLSLLQSATAVAVLASAVFLLWSYGAEQRSWGPVAASAAAIFPAALLMGLSFPILLRVGVGPADVGNSAATAARVGRLYALNVAGAVAGALLGGFALLPGLGVRGALIGTAGLFAATGCLLALQATPKRWGVLGAAAGLAAFAWMAAQAPDPVTAASDRRHGREQPEVWRHEGVQATVSVRGRPSRRALHIDGVAHARDAPDVVRLHRAIGHLPMLLHPAPADVLVVGLGGGATAGAASRHPGVRIQVVELLEGVRLAVPLFAHVSYDVLGSPNVRLRVDDGRNFLLWSGQRFDVVTADLIQPQHAGSGHLYSREYFRLLRRALKPGGIALQWTGPRSGNQYRLIMRTFLEVFPDATLWFDGTLMAGSLAPPQLRRSVFEARRAEAATRAALDEAGLPDFESLAGWFTAGAREMRAFVGAGPVLTDDRPLVEFYRSLPRRSPPLDLSVLRGDVARLIVE